jgi:hypothetical protein
MHANNSGGYLHIPSHLIDGLETPPKSGGGLHSWIFNMALKLQAHCSPDETFTLLTKATSCRNLGRAVPPREILEAVRSVYNISLGSIPNSTGYRKWPQVDKAARKAIIPSHLGVQELVASSPVTFDQGKRHAEEIIDTLFPGNPLLCVGSTVRLFITQQREKWRGKLEDRQLIVPSAMSSATGLTKDGRKSPKTNNNTGPRRFLVIEQDTIDGVVIPKDEQAAVLFHLGQRAPLVLVVSSGGKSVHGWFYCAGQPEPLLRGFMEHAVALGADHATWTKSQFVRIPDGTRENGKRQEVLYFNPSLI